MPWPGHAQVVARCSQGLSKATAEASTRARVASAILLMEQSFAMSGELITALEAVASS